jgi:hypothetical protein
MPTPTELLAARLSAKQDIDIFLSQKALGFTSDGILGPIYSRWPSGSNEQCEANIRGALDTLNTALLTAVQRGELDVRLLPSDLQGSIQPNTIVALPGPYVAKANSNGWCC